MNPHSTREVMASELRAWCDSLQVIKMNQPTALELLGNAGVIDQLRRAFEESCVGTDRAVEQGGFIVRDPASVAIEVVRLPARNRDSFAYSICADGMFHGKQIIGSFHTHPNIGAEWRPEPSLQDIRLSQDYPDTMGPHQFVIASEKIYHIDREGVVTVMGNTHQLLGIGEGRSQ